MKNQSFLSTNLFATNWSHHDFSLQTSRSRLICVDIISKMSSFSYNEFRHTSRRSGSQAAAAAVNWSDTDPTAYYSLIHSCAERVAVTSGAAHLSVCWLQDVHTCSVCLWGSLLPHKKEISCGEPGDLEGAGATWERSSFAFKNTSETYGQTHQRMGISTYWHTW